MDDVTGGDVASGYDRASGYDDVAAYNVARWRALADAGAVYTRPLLDLDAESARDRVDPEGWLGPVDGQRVLCLAGGGGQQSVAFALLGARVTVVDLSAAQLERDRAAAAHYGVVVETIQADMRDLSRLDAAAYDVVWQPYSINFVPDARAVFGQVARVIRPGGRYHLRFANPFVLGVAPRHWDGRGYPLRQPYLDGACVESEDEAWTYRRDAVTGPPIPGPREYRHTLATIVNGLAEHGFVIRRLSDAGGFSPDPEAAPGTWDHFVAVAPPWLAVWCRYEPHERDVVARGSVA